MAFDAQGNWKPEDDAVSSRVTALTSQDSPLMQQARAGAMKTAQRRGLLNSTMAARSGEDAAITAALPIASQEASQVATKNQQFMANQVATRGQDLDFSATTRGQDIQKDLGLMSDATTRRAQDFDMSKNADALAAKAAETLVSAGTNYASMFASIMGNEKMSATDRSNFLASAKAQTQTMQNLVASTMGLNLPWGSSPAAPAPAPAANSNVSAYTPPVGSKVRAR
jgi:hypothetical protein